MLLERLEIQTRATVEFYEITAAVQRALSAAESPTGLCYLFCPHTTAGLTINENADPDVRHDMLAALDRLVPLHDPAYRHAEGNAAAHLKASMMGFSVVLPVREGRLVLGTWQGIYLCEFDGPRRRHLHLTLVPVA